MNQLANDKRVNTLEQQWNKKCANLYFRFSVTPPPSQFKTSHFRVSQNREKHSYFSTDLNNRSLEYLSHTKSIKNKLEKLFNKESKESLKNWVMGSQGKVGKKGKSLFFKGNYKLNKNKKELEQLNRRTIAEGFEKQSDFFSRATNELTTLIIREDNAATERIDKFNEECTNEQNDTVKTSHLCSNAKIKRRCVQCHSNNSYRRETQSSPYQSNQSRKGCTQSNQYGNNNHLSMTDA
jgi:hypothetical protein